MKNSLKKIVKPRSWWHRTALLIIGALLVVSLAVGGVRYVYNDNLKPLSRNQHQVTVVIPLGSSLPEIAKQLKQQKIIKSEWAFKQYVRNQQASDVIKAGTYELSPGYSVQEIVSIITEGKIKTNLVTILPGQRLDQIRKALINNGFSAAAVDKALDPAQYPNHPALVDKPREASLEGYLYPESFQKTASTTPETIIRASLDEMQERLTPDMRSAITARGLNVYQGLILASMIEQEGNNDSDRAKIAQVFYSRLDKGMRLESDPTAFYGAQIAGQPDSVNYDTPYNTYKRDGLPPGPISNITESSLEAVARPANTNFLYFVAGDDGTVHYSSTIEEHQALVRQYCKKLCAPH